MGARLRSGCNLFTILRLLRFSRRRCRIRRGPGRDVPQHDLISLGDDHENSDARIGARAESGAQPGPVRSLPCNSRGQAWAQRLMQALVENDTEDSTDDRAVGTLNGST